jgi:cytochrome b
MGSEELTMTAQHQSQLVWDVPTRLFHWLLVALLGFSWWSAETDHMLWHRYSGLVVSGLMVFRLLWGFIGSSTARFTQFVKGPRAVWRYVRADGDSATHTPGHNPLGGWSVIALLLMVSVQFISGLFAIDIDGLEEGPLSYLIEFDQGRLAARIHHQAFNVLLALVAMHVIAIVFYLLVKRRNLIGAMLTGFTRRHDGHHAIGAMAVAPHWRLLVAVVIAVSLACLIANGLQL